MTTKMRTKAFCLKWQNLLLLDIKQYLALISFHKIFIKPGLHYTSNVMTTTQKQSDYKVEQSSFTLIALFSLKIGRCSGRNWLNGNQAL